MRRWLLVASTVLIGTAGVGGNAWAATSPSGAQARVAATKVSPHAVAGHESFKAGTKQVIRLDPTSVQPKLQLQPRLARPLLTTPTAKINVTYIGFSAPARAAFQAAVDVWQTQIHSTVPINVVADWSNLGDPNILGAAGPTAFVSNFTNAPAQNVWYPLALANAISGSDQAPANVCASDPSFPDASGAEITASFNSAQPDWYYGSGTMQSYQVDLESVVLHELGHGLGFVGSYDGLDPATGNDTGRGYAGMTGDGQNLTVFDTLTSDSSGTPLTSYANGSLALGSVLRGGANGARWNGAYGIAANGGTRPLLYSPGPSSPPYDQSWEEGSSFSHLDEGTYPAGNPNALMTPFLHRGEVTHGVGPVVLGMFEDMDWPQTGSPAPTTGDYHVAAPMRLVNHATVRNGAPAHFQVTGRDGVPVSGVTSVAVNIAVQVPSIAGYWATLPGCAVHAGMPNTQNFAARQTRTSLAVIPVDDTGAVTVSVGASGNAAVSAVVSVDLVGWYGSGGVYYHQLPSQKQAFGKIVGTRAVDVPILGVAGVPRSGVTAVVLTAGVGFQSAPGVVVVGPGGTTSIVPTVAYNRGELLSNLAIVPVNAGKIRVRTTAGTSAVVLNVVGWYGPAASAGLTFHSAGPAHLPVAARGPDVTIGGLPGSTLVMLDVHLLRPTAIASLSAGPGGTSSLATVQEFMANQSGSGTFITTTNAAGQVRLHLSSGWATFYADFQGWFST